MKKLSLSPIRIKSFVTSLNSDEKKVVKGGTDPMHCATPETCGGNTCVTCPTNETCLTCVTCNTCDSCIDCTESDFSLCPVC
jgi:hypothetical protein